MSSGPKIFDRPLLRARQKRARAIRPATFLLDRVAGELGERLSAVLRQFDVAVDLGTPTDAVRRRACRERKSHDDRRCRIQCNRAGQFISARRRR